MKHQNIIFLDIDGPMIPSSCYLAYGVMASFERRFSPLAVACINRLCHETKAKIVFNTTHNRFYGDKLVDEAIREGIKKGFIHPTSPKTKYPELNNRLEAIHLWIKENPEKPVRWVSFDDADVGENNILIDFDYGVGVKEINQAMKILNKGTPVIIL